MIDSTGAFSCIDLIKSHSSASQRKKKKKNLIHPKKEKKNYSGDLCERKVKQLEYFFFQSV